ncbi:twin-arginine translocase subunit TatC [soil metagenome]
MKWSGLFGFRDQQDEPKPFLDHIEDLRWMLIKSIAVLIIAMGVSFCFQNALISLIMRPLHDIDLGPKGLMNTGIIDPLLIAIELSFYCGLIFSFPFIIFFLAEFILPALTPKEKRMLYPASAASMGMFLLGAAFAYFVVLPQGLKYFFNYSKSLNFAPQWTVHEYFSFATQFVLSFGLAFELPLGVLILVKLGILSHATLQKTRSFAIVIILFLSAIIMPAPDVFSMLVMAVPMYILYEGCIWIAWYMERRERRQAASGSPKFTLE